MDSFESVGDASASQLGNQYQLLLALCSFLPIALEDPANALIYERIDDHAIVSDQTLVESAQTKHHESAGNLTDYSPDFWRTIEIWLDISAQEVAGDSTRFTLTTTHHAAPGSGISYLSDNSSRNVSSARASLEIAALKCSNTQCRGGIAAFSALTQPERLDFLQRCYILTGSPNTEQLRNEIFQQLRFGVKPSHVGAAYHRLLGWWSDRVQHHLEKRPSDRIRGSDFQNHYYDLLEQFRDTNLPIDEAIAQFDSVELVDVAGHHFVAQLELIALQAPALRVAILDYYKAYTQRVRWLQDDLIYTGDLDRYERRIRNEWQAHFSITTESFHRDSSPSDLIDAGKTFYKDFVVGRNDPIRPLCTEGFVYRGTCHILADDLTIGWHPEFINRLRDVLEAS